MKKSRILAFLFGIFVVVLSGGIIALGSAHIAPPVKIVEKPIPDAQIPR